MVYNVASLYMGSELHRVMLILPIIPLMYTVLQLTIVFQ